MIHKLRFYLVIACLLAMLGCSRDQFDVPKPRVERLDNGMTVFLLEDQSLPTFRLFAYWPAGSVFESPEEVGIAEITAEVLRTGGTKRHRPDEIDQMLSDLSASIEFSSDTEAGMVSLRSLSADRLATLGLLAEMLQEPAFGKAAFILAQRQAEVALQQALEKPSDIASLYFPATIYGYDSPWGRVPTLKGLENLKLEQSEAFYQSYYNPNRMFIAVAGDFKSQEVLGELKQTIGKWQRGDPGAVTWPGVSSQPPQARYYGKASKQVAVIAGHQGAQRDDPDKFALIVANFILGGSGSMTSRLGSQIRADQGQAYSVWSLYGFNRVPGIFSMVAQTESSQMEEVVHDMRGILKEYREHGPSPEELADAKEAILRSLLFDYQSRYAIAKDWARFEFWGYPRDYLKIFTRRIRDVEMEDVKRVLRERFHPEQLSYLVVGPQWLWQQTTANWPALELIDINKDEEVDGVEGTTH